VCRGVHALFRLRGDHAPRSVPINGRILSGVTRCTGAWTSAGRFAGSVPIEPFEGSRWRLRRARQRLWDLN
jgi:hypothetical protein